MEQKLDGQLKNLRMKRTWPALAIRPGPGGPDQNEKAHILQSVLFRPYRHRFCRWGWFGYLGRFWLRGRDTVHCWGRDRGSRGRDRGNRRRWDGEARHKAGGIGIGHKRGGSNIQTRHLKQVRLIADISREEESWSQQNSGWEFLLTQWISFFKLAWQHIIVSIDV